jgi:hypothetical protein
MELDGLLQIASPDMFQGYRRRSRKKGYPQDFADDRPPFFTDKETFILEGEIPIGRKNIFAAIRTLPIALKAKNANYFKFL